MEPLAELLDQKLQQWSPETGEEVRRLLGEIMELADEGLLDVMRSRGVVQEVLDRLDWFDASALGLSAAYGPAEPEYTAEMVKGRIQSPCMNERR